MDKLKTTHLHLVWQERTILMTQMNCIINFLTLEIRMDIMVKILMSFISSSKVLINKLQVKKQINFNKWHILIKTVTSRQLVMKLTKINILLNICTIIQLMGALRAMKLARLDSIQLSYLMINIMVKRNHVFSVNWK